MRPLVKVPGAAVVAVVVVVVMVAVAAVELVAVAPALETAVDSFPFFLRFSLVLEDELLVVVVVVVVFVVAFSLLVFTDEEDLLPLGEVELPPEVAEVRRDDLEGAIACKGIRFVIAA